MVNPPQVTSHVIFDGRQFMSFNHFVDVGDEIPLHVHQEFAHISLCIVGECEIFDADGKTAVLMPGHFVEFAKGRWHGLRAKLPGTVVINLRDGAGDST
jgi:quercetin dioxygenase-like cupin family protein